MIIEISRRTKHEANQRVRAYLTRFKKCPEARILKMDGHLRYAVVRWLGHFVQAAPLQCIN